MRWLITGGCGFIGKRLVQGVIARGGDTVRVIDDLSVGSREDLAEVTAFEEVPREGLGDKAASVELVVGDVRDAAMASAVAADVDVVVHLAANTGVGPSVEDPRADCETNVFGTLNFLEACREHGVPRFVFASSGAPIGEAEPPLHEELAPHPASPYGASKLAGEGYCSAYAASFGVETVALRFGNVYGPGSTHKGSAVAKFIRQALVGETIEIYGDGQQTRDFIYIDDLIEAIEAAATAPGLRGEVFQVAANTETTVSELVERLLAVLETRGIARPPVVQGEPRVGDVRRNYSDTTKARARLGWTCRHDLGAGLPRTVDWFLADGEKSVDDLTGSAK